VNATHKHFQFTRRPFASVPDADYFVATPSIADVMGRLEHGIAEATGPALLIGSTGTGKSTILNVLARSFATQFSVIHLAGTRLKSRLELLQNMLFELDLPFLDASEGELRLALIDYLKPSARCRHGLLLLVDEAQTMPLSLLEEIRLITNLVRNGQPRVRLCLAGTSRLEERLGHPQLASLNQRIAVRCYLQTLVRDESYAYLLAHLGLAGRDGREIVKPSALQAIHDLSEGVPRVLNQLAESALAVAAQQELPTIDAAIVRQAWAVMQCLPNWTVPGTPSLQASDEFPGAQSNPALASVVWRPSPHVFNDKPESPANPVADAVVEFGQLDSDDQPPRQRAREMAPQPPLRVPEPTPTAAARRAHASLATSGDVEPTLNDLLTELNELGYPRTEGSSFSDETRPHDHEPRATLTFPSAHKTHDVPLGRPSGSSPDPFAESFEHEEPLAQPHEPAAVWANRQAAQLSEKDLAVLHQTAAPTQPSRQPLVTLSPGRDHKPADQPTAATPAASTTGSTSALRAAGPAATPEKHVAPPAASTDKSIKLPAQDSTNESSWAGGGQHQRSVPSIATASTEPACEDHGLTWSPYVILAGQGLDCQLPDVSDAPEEPGLAIEYPLVDHQSYGSAGPHQPGDDRDMIRVRHSPDSLPNPPVQTDWEIPSAETSQGTAVRMDYRDLFNQLRGPQNS